MADGCTIKHQRFKIMFACYFMFLLRNLESQARQEKVQLYVPHGSTICTLRSQITSILVQAKELLEFTHKTSSSIKENDTNRNLDLHKVL